MTHVRAISIAASLLAFVTFGLLSGDTTVVPTAAADSWSRIRVPADADPVRNGERFQAALDAAQPGDFIELPAGGIFAGNFVLPYKPGGKWIVIYSSLFWRFPSPGTRVSPADADLMPKIVSQNTDPAIRVAAGAHHYAFFGIEVTTTSPTSADLIYLDFFGQTLEQVPTDIILYHCYVHGTPEGDIRRGVALNGARLAIIGSYFSDFHHRSEDAQAIMGWNGPGPFWIVGNYLEAAGENVLFGGTDPTIPGLVPADIQIRGNHFFKPLSWRVGDPSYAGINWVVKNLFELKNARRVLVDGNVFENNWYGNAQTQDGLAIVFTPRNQDGTAPWSTVQDVTFTHNIVRRSTGGFYILGWDNFQPSQQLQRLLIRDNLLVDIGAFPSGLSDSGVLFLVADGPSDMVIDHNTAIQAGHPIGVMTQVEGRWPATGFVFTNNITRNNQGVSDGTPRNPLLTLGTYFSAYLFTHNVLVGGEEAAYPSGNFFPATLNEVGFVDDAGGDYSLAGSSSYRHAGTDGKDIGADVRALLAIMDGWGLPVRP